MRAPVLLAQPRRAVIMLLGVATAAALLVLVSWAMPSQPSAMVTAAAPSPATPGPTTPSPAGVSSTVGALVLPTPANGVAAPAPFIQNFGPPAGTPRPTLPSPTSPVPFPVGDGCDHTYGDANQCVPVQFPPGVTDGCAWLSAHGFGPLAVHGTDRLGLDPNGDGIACGPGDG